MDMEGFSQLFWANLTSCHFCLFFYFTPLYISLIYGAFLEKVLKVFNDNEKDKMKKKHEKNNKIWWKWDLRSE